MVGLSQLKIERDELLLIMLRYDSDFKFDYLLNSLNKRIEALEREKMNKKKWYQFWCCN